MCYIRCSRAAISFSDIKLQTKEEVIHEKQNLLAVLYVLMFAIILYINGAFSGESISVSNLAINVAFLIVIGILFIISFVSFSRLNRVTDSLVDTAEEMSAKYESVQKSLWDEYRTKKDTFSSPVLNRQFDRYQKRIAASTNAKGTISRVCSLEEYINEDLLDNVVSAHFNSAVGGTLTGLGILGTFIGLSMGMISFTGSDVFTISDNIAPLLDGMKVAFHTSVYGIFFSIVFNFVYRSLMADAYGKLSRFLMTFQECAAPVPASVDENTSAMLIYQANTANALKRILELLKGNAEEQSKGLDRVVQQFVNQMSDVLGADFEQLGKTLHESCEAQGTYARNFQRLEESTRLLLESSRTMNETLTMTLERQKELEEKLSSTCDDLSNELYTFHQMRDLYEK